MKQNKFSRFTRSLWRPVEALLRILFESVALFIVGYGIFALFVSTDVEKQLLRENRMYSKQWSGMKAQSKMVSDAVEALKYKDGTIYESIFHAPPPPMDPVSTLGFLFGSDTIPDTKIVAYTARKADALESDADFIEARLRNTLFSLSDRTQANPPFGLPVKELTFSQVGASVGMKMSPFLKVKVEHNGLDLLIPEGEVVLAAADGTVKKVERSTKGAGNVVEIAHADGYVTRYCHMSLIIVSSGQTVKAGKPIGTVGMTGNAFVPHLHYEVLKDGQYLDPMNFIAASVAPEEYANMLFMAVNTYQSMD